MGRVRLRRAIGGEWLHQDVPVELAVTRGLAGKNRAVGTVPTSLDVPAHDGLPMWLERSTVAYVEDDTGDLEFVGLLAATSPSRDGRRIEFGGLLSLYDLIVYDWFLSAWEPGPADVLSHLLTVAHAQPVGVIAPTLVVDGVIGGYLGDEKPPDRPAKPAQNPGESLADYNVRVDAWDVLAAAWDDAYGDREPFELHYYDHRYVGDEVADIVAAAALELRETSHWDGLLDPVHELTVGPVLGTVRDDIALVQGVNLVGDLAPATVTDSFGDDVWVLGTGSNEETRLGRATSLFSHRVRTARVYQANDVSDVGVLNARAAALLSVIEPETGSGALATAQARAGTLPDLLPGDVIPVRTDLFTGYARVLEVGTLTSAGGLISLKFDTGADS